MKKYVDLDWEFRTVAEGWLDAVDIYAESDPRWADGVRYCANRINEILDGIKARESDERSK